VRVQPLIAHFFGEGRLRRAYTLGELLDDVDRVRLTASHFLWLSSRSLRFEGELLRLVTTECQRLEFNVRTGEFSNESLVAATTDDHCVR
jgi:hypothetical protein